MSRCPQARDRPGDSALAAAHPGPVKSFVPAAYWTFDCGDYVRRLRRHADLSQRELARVSGVSRGVIERIEAGTVDPKVGQLQALLDLVSWGVTVTDVDGRLVIPLREFEENLRDGADRRFPAHLDVIVDPRPGGRWAGQYRLSRPPEGRAAGAVAVGGAVRALPTARLGHCG